MKDATTQGKVDELYADDVFCVVVASAAH